MVKLISTLRAIFDRFIDVFAFVAGILTIFMMLAISSEVVARYFLNKPITGVVEVSETCMLWIVFLGATWVLKKEGHVSMDVLDRRLRPRAKAVLNVITSLMSAAVTWILFWYGAKVTWALLEKGTLELGALEMPIALVLFVIPLGSLLLFIQFLRRAYGYWRGAKVTKTEEYL